MRRVPIWMRDRSSHQRLIIGLKAFYAWTQRVQRRDTCWMTCDAERTTNTHTHLFVTLLLPSLFQGESSQLIGSLLHQVDIADWIGQGFNDVWGQGRKERWWKNHVSSSVFLLSCDHLTYLQMCLGHSPLLQHTQTEQVTSGTGSSHSSDWCSDSLQGLGSILILSFQKQQFYIKAKNSWTDTGFFRLIQISGNETIFFHFFHRHEICTDFPKTVTCNYL